MNDRLTPHRAQRRQPFTLIELLVVVAIIAILASMLLPALSSARERARRTSCLGNANQLNLGVQMFVDDYNGFYPNRFNGYVGQEHPTERTVMTAAEMAVNQRHRSQIKAVMRDYMGQSPSSICPSNPSVGNNTTLRNAIVQQDVEWGDANTGTMWYAAGGFDLLYAELRAGVPAPNNWPGRGRVRQNAVKLPSEYAVWHDRIVLATTSGPMGQWGRFTNHGSGDGAVEGGNQAMGDGSGRWVPWSGPGFSVVNSTYVQGAWFVRGTSSRGYGLPRGNPWILINSPNTIYNNRTDVLDVRRSCEVYTNSTDSAAAYAE